MKSILFIFIINAILFVTAQSNNYIVFSLQVPGCENATLELNQCSYYCNKHGSISGNYSNFELTFFSDSYCTEISYVDQNTPFIAFNCNEEKNQLGNDGFISCSNLLPEYHSFQIYNANLLPEYHSFQIYNANCEDKDKIFSLGQCTSICGIPISINYDPFKGYTFSTYLDEECSKTIGSVPFECDGTNGLACYEFYSFSSSSSIHINYTFIIISIVLILFIIK